MSIERTSMRYNERYISSNCASKMASTSESTLFSRIDTIAALGETKNPTERLAAYVDIGLVAIREQIDIQIPDGPLKNEIMTLVSSEVVVAHIERYAALIELFLKPKSRTTHMPTNALLKLLVINQDSEKNLVENSTKMVYSHQIRFNANGKREFLVPITASSEQIRAYRKLLIGSMAMAMLCGFLAQLCSPTAFSEQSELQSVLRRCEQNFNDWSITLVNTKAVN